MKEEEAKRLIEEPVKKACDYDPFDTPSGQEVIKSLIDWSGCFPNYLMLLCDRLFNYFKPFFVIQKKIDQPSTVEILRKLIKEFANKESILFDPILKEDADDNEKGKPDKIKTYLRFLAEKTYDSTEHQCSENIICETLGKDENYAIRNLLISRGILDLDKGKLRIKVGLYREFTH